jgi:ribosome biogenesis GTPase
MLRLMDAELQPARVARVDGPSCLLITVAGRRRGETSNALFHESADGTSLPAVGDWVAIRPRLSHDTDLIESVLPRASALIRTRQVMDSSVERQTLAANLDTVFIVQAANNLNARRLEREVAQVASSGARAAVILSKSDLCDDIDDALWTAQSSVPGVPAHAVSGVTGHGAGELLTYVSGNRTVAFIGASGVGKSTLTNRLLGEDVMDTGEVREDDQRGRHTTTARHLIPLPGGGALIDTPGMRSFGLSDAGEGVGEVFADIAALASRCRFPDCAHRSEPGCAVMEAIFTGELDEDRFRSFAKLNRELEFIESKADKRLQVARNDVWKKRAREMRKRYEGWGKYGKG